ncbi:MAG TPA: hypothetical protein PLZ20_16105 [Nitrospira sp.]|nr:hypothetical protein [Nitrospira sp.]
MEFLIHALDSLFTSLGWGVILVLIALGILLHLFKFILPFWVTPTILGLLGLVFVGSTLTKSFQIKELENQLLTMQRDAEQYRAASEVKARSAETELATGAAETRKKTNEKTRTVDARSRDLLEWVRRAEEAKRNLELSRSSSTADAGATPPGDHGTQLLGSLGGADVEEAQRADTIRLHLKACYADYARAEKTLKDMKQDE